MPLKVDRLSQNVKDAITAGRNEGLIWKEIAALVSRKAGMKVSAMSCQRWYHLRVLNRPPALDLQEITKLLRQILNEVRTCRK